MALPKPKGSPKKKGLVAVGLVVAGVAAVYLYKKYAGSSAATPAAAAADPGATVPGYATGDDSGGGGGGGGGSPTATGTGTATGTDYTGTGTTGTSTTTPPVLTPVNYGAGVTSVTSEPGVFIETTPTSSGATPGSVDIRKV